jgi:hypothetical protein
LTSVGIPAHFLQRLLMKALGGIERKAMNVLSPP